MKMERKKHLKFSIRTKMATAFLGLSLLSLIVSGYIAFNGMTVLSNYSFQSSIALGNSAANDSIIALENQAEGNLLRLAVDQADISNNAFKKVESEMQILAHFASKLLNSSSLTPKPLYSQQEKPASIYDASVYLLAPNANIDDLRNELNYTSNMDDVFATVYANDPLLAQVFMGTESGILQLYPWSSGIDASYDPTLREWYKNAKEKGGIYWSEPYIDAAGHGLMVTCAAPVATPQKDFSWVIGADVTIDTINQNIINTQIGELGYALLLDSNGKVIARPGLASGDQKWDESFETDNLLLSNNKQLRDIAQNMTEGKTGITRCTFEDGDKYVAYSPLNSTKWSLSIVLPVEEIIAPALLTQDKISNSTNNAREHINSQVKTVRTTFGGMFVLMLILVSAIALLLSRRIVNPIMTLMKGAKAVGAADLNYRVKIESGDELESLAGSFNKMAQDLQEHVAELQRTTAEKERLLKELDIAKGIQQSFLPEKEPKIEGIDIAASNIPAREIGGDFYDFIPIAADKWGLTIADVSGKGVPAALFMALSRTLVRASTTGNPKVSDAIEKANNLICADSKSGMFVTLFYAILDAKKRNLKYVNAGHNPPLLIREPMSGILMLKAKGIALGVVEDVKLQEADIPLQKGDLITLYTDGVTEAINGKEEQFGQHRLLKILEENRFLPAKDIVRKIQAEVAAFSGGQPQFDDITLMILKVT